MQLTRKEAQQLAGGDRQGDGTRSRRNLPSTYDLRNVDNKELIKILKELGLDNVEIIDDSD